MTQIKLEERIRKKEQEIVGWEQQIAAAREYVRATREALALIMKDDGRSTTDGLRASGSAAQALEYLQREGKARHIRDIVTGIGKKNDRNNRSAVAAQLSAYAREGRIFSRPAPNTFGLLVWDSESNGGGGVQMELHN